MMRVSSTVRTGSVIVAVAAMATACSDDPLAPQNECAVTSPIPAAAVDGIGLAELSIAVHDAAVRNAAALPDDDATTDRLRSAFNTLSQELDGAEREEVCVAAVNASLALASQPERPVTSPDRSALRLVLDIAAAVLSRGK